MTTATIYHNPRCSKSRQTLALLEGRGIEPTVVRYLETPPSAKELDAICRKLGKEPQAIVRRKEARFKELGLGDGERSRQAWLQVLSENPILIERPIVVVGDEAALGRPPEDVLALL